MANPTMIFWLRSISRAGRKDTQRTPPWDASFIEHRWQRHKYGLDVQVENEVGQIQSKEYCALPLSYRPRILFRLGGIVAVADRGGYRLRASLPLNGERPVTALQ